jgi:AraC-like DNA-binding protein
MTERSTPLFSSQFFHCYRPPALADVVDSIWDWDIPDADIARALTISQAPGTPLLLVGRYRAPVRCQQGQCELPAKFVTQIRDAPVTLRPTGALGVIVVAIKPESARRIIDGSLGEFANANRSLVDFFGQSVVTTCDEAVAAAHTSAERAAAVEKFLLRRLRPAAADSAAQHVAVRLRDDPMLRIAELAAEIGTSTRHLGRMFHAVFGTSPKNFARLARVEKIIGLRQRGFTWAQIAYACGLADQAHLVREFKALVGESPSHFFANPLCAVSGPAAGAPFIVRPDCTEVRKLQAFDVLPR